MSGQKPGKFGNTRGQGWSALDGIVQFLRARHPEKTAENVSADTGIARDTVRKLLDRVARPSFDTFTALVLGYGPALLLAALPQSPEWLSEAAHRERVAEAEHHLAEAQAALIAAREERA